jgi:PhoPQ-activated pathogenicity-related protein
VILPIRCLLIGWLLSICISSPSDSIVIAAEEADQKSPGPLKAYVQQPDSSFHWVKRREGKLAGGSYIELTLTSQTWHDVAWKHQLFLFKPAEVQDSSRALLLIGGGAWRDEFAREAKGEESLPREASLLAAVAAQIRAPVAVLLHVPHQPMFGGMVEDQIISYTFERYLKTRDDTWPLLLPMVKSVVRGMDSIQACAKQEWSFTIERFLVTGASKRGWTTWLTAAVDPRVEAIAPMVIDMLNMGPQMKHQVASWGGFSEQIRDYTERGIQDSMQTRQGDALRQIIDPYSYRPELKMPKLILLGTNDRYWPLDALNLYWDALPGEKHVLYIPNNGHSLRDFPRMVGTIAALHRQSAGELKLAQPSWKFEEQADAVRLRIDSDVKPRQVSIWMATAPTRDFRDATWESRPADVAGAAYEYQQARPAKGFAAFFGEAVYSTDKSPYYLSTNVRILAAQGEKK